MILFEKDIVLQEKRWYEKKNFCKFVKYFICTQINEELEQRQKVIVLIRILEFIFADPITLTKN